MVAPTRVVLEAGEKAGQVYVVNKGTEPMTVRVSVVNRRMHEDGRLTEVEMSGPGEQFANGLIEFAPRRFRLSGGQGQTVRILARRPVDLRPGEYRSHLQFHIEPSSNRTEDAGTPEKSVSIQLIPVYGVTIPVILREGNLAASTAISDLTIASPASRGEPPSVSFQLHRQGTRSIYGDIKVFLKPAGGAERLVAQARGLAVYPPLDMRRVSFPLESSAPAAASSGQVRVQYVDHDNGKVLAEAEAVIP